MLRAIIVVIVLICCAADAAQAFRWPFFFVRHYHRRGHYRYAVPTVVPLVPHDCTKIKAARKDITHENWIEVERQLNDAQRQFIESCMAGP